MHLKCSGQSITSVSKANLTKNLKS